MHARLVGLAGSAVVLGFVFTGVACADTTLGSTTPPSGSTTHECTTPAPYPTLVQSAQDASTPFFAPTGGAITQWQMNVTGDTAGAPITFAAVRATAGGDYTVVGADNETVPSPLPASGVATFVLSSPIVVDTGDTLALYSSSNGVGCYFSGGSTPASDNIASVDDAVPPPSAGQTLTSPETCGEMGGCTLNVAATLVTTQDAGVTIATGSSDATVGYPALLSWTVTNNGPAAGPITLTDAIPAGLTVNAVAAGSGTCTTSGQQVTCTIAGLDSGQSAPVDIVVTPTAAGSYSNGASVAVSSPNTDPNTTNNTALATLTVHTTAAPAAPVAPVTPPASAAPAAPVTPKCVVLRLNGIRLSFAKQLMHLLDCTAGSVRYAHSRSVQKGYVIATSPGPGTYTAGRKIAFVVSSGPKKKHDKR